MYWNKKVEMVDLFNTDSKQIYPFLKEHTKEIIEDPQAFEMFLDCISLIPEELSENKELFSTFIVSEEIYNKLSLVSKLRYEVLKTTLSEIN